MYCVLEILRCILCCNDECHSDRDYETLVHSTSYDTAVTSSPACSVDLLRPSDPTNIYTNSSVSKLTTKESIAVSFESKYDNKSLQRCSEGSRNSSTSPKFPQSLAKQTPCSSNPYLSSCKLSFSPPKVSVSLTQSSSFRKPPSSSSTGAPPALPSSVASSLSSLRQSLSSVKSPPFSPAQPVSSAKPPPSSFKPSPPLCGSYQALSQPTPSSLKTPASSEPRKPMDVEDWIKKDVLPNISNKPLSKPTLSALPLDSKNRHKQMKPKDVQDLIKKDAVPNIPKKPLSKPTLSALPFDSTYKQTEANYRWVEKETTTMYVIPKDIEEVIRKDVVPNVLKEPLSPSTYKDYFAALLYAEDFYIEKWSKFQLLDITLKFHKAAIYNKSSKNKNLKASDEKDDKTFIAFKIDSVPEKRPFLLSRDFVFARHAGRISKEFRGIIYLVVKSNIVLVEFEENFYSQHQSNHKYDISFSFNRVCLKRAHQAIAAASGPLFRNFLFPRCASRRNNPESTNLPYHNYRLESDQNSAVHHILSLQGSPPYLVEGPLSVRSKQLSETGIVVKEAVIQIYQRSTMTRILICAPINKTCDALMASLKKEIPESDMFRANAAFREIDGVPAEILPLCRFEGECFTCPSLEKLRQFRVIFSTFVSSFRLHDKGITAGHFSHIFLVDTSSTTEPETMIPLSNLANENTSVIVTGASNNRSSWVRSDIARKNGLRISYFERLCENETYKSLEPMFITQLKLW